MKMSKNERKENEKPSRENPVLPTTRGELVGSS